MHHARKIATSAAFILGLLPFAGQAQDTYTTSGTEILKNGSPAIFAGVNALGIYGPNASAMNGLSINIVREPMTDMALQPISGPGAAGTYGYLHSLQDVVNDNRANGKVTIFVPGYWVASGSQLAGTTPSQQPFFSDFQTKMRQIATQFKNQPDVWLEVWNEPYSGTNPASWLSDMQALVDNIRVTGNQNIVLVPGSYWDSSEDVILSQGKTLLGGRSNILFTLHGYTWEYSSTATSVARVKALRNDDFAVIFGEAGPQTATGNTDPANFLNAMLDQKVSTLLWIYKDDASDPNSLLANDRYTAWGTQGFAFLASLLNGASATGISSTAWYTATNQSSGRCIDAANWGVVNGTFLQQWSCGQQQPNQEWQFQPTDSGYYKVVSRNAPTEAWDVFNVGTENGSPLQLWQYFGGTNQQWMPVSLGNGTYKFVGRGSGRCLDVPGASTANGARLQIYTCNGTGAQAFHLQQQP